MVHPIIVGAADLMRQGTDSALDALGVCKDARKKLLIKFPGKYPQHVKHDEARDAPTARAQRILQPNRAAPAQETNGPRTATRW
jgi:hypothetical protein